MGQKIGIDSSILIYLLEDKGALSDQSETILKKVERGEFQAIFASLGMIEILTGPKKLGRHDLAQEYKHLLVNFPNLIIADLSERIIDLASDLRAKYGIATPDAIHIATALNFSAKKFFTNDKKLKKVKEIKVEIIGG